jgi:hypothetical protein
MIANQRLNIEKSLIKFKIRSNPTYADSIFNDDTLKEPAFSLIENKQTKCPFLNALINDNEPNMYS